LAPVAGLEELPEGIPSLRSEFGRSGSHHTTKSKNKIHLSMELFLLPSSKLIIILENRDYMANLKEKLTEIKQIYRSLQLVPNLV
jgi:hypothetical protein